MTTEKDMSYLLAYKCQLSITTFHEWVAGTVEVVSVVGVACFHLLQFEFAKNISSKVLCTQSYDPGKAEDKKKLKFLYDRIHEDYMHQWVIDNMPVTWCYSITESDQQYCTTRFPVGCYVTIEGVRHDACYLSVSLVECSNGVGEEMRIGYCGTKG